MMRSFAVPVIAMSLLTAGCNPGAEMLAHVSTDNNNKFIDCGDGNDLHVTGSNNNLKVKGRCGKVSITGDNNNVLLPKADHVAVEGANNNIAFAGSASDVNDSGKDNRIAAH